MSGLFWWLKTFVGASMASPFLFLGREFLFSGRFAVGAVTLSVGLITAVLPHWYARRVRAKQDRARETFSSKISQIREVVPVDSEQD
jgi:hypothetical protein